MFFMVSMIGIWLTMNGIMSRAMNGGWMYLILILEYNGEGRIRNRINIFKCNLRYRKRMSEVVQQFINQGLNVKIIT